MKNSVNSIASIASIASISVGVKDFYSKSYGNSYFSARVTITRKNGDVANFNVPYMCGYGTHYQYAILNHLLVHLNLSPERTTIIGWSMRNNITLTMLKQDNCLKKVVKAWGK